MQLNLRLRRQTTPSALRAAGPAGEIPNRGFQAGLHSAFLCLLFIFGLARAAVAPLLAAEGAASAGRERETQVPPDAQAAKGYRIVAGDVVSINVFPAEEYSREMTVQPDGKIEMQLIGGILVKGLTSRELQDLLADKLSKYVADPKVTVNVRRFSGRRVAIIGDIRSPGYYDYRDGMTLLELVAQAGGLAEHARASRVRILHEGPGASVTRVNFKAVLSGELDRDVPMTPGDVVYVPKGSVTLAAQWTNANILPWLLLMTLVSSIILLVHTNTGSSSTPSR